MKLNLKVLPGYLVFIFLLQSLSVFFQPEAAGHYLSIAIIVMGLGAIFCQKKLHQGRFLDMGFRLNRNVPVGLFIGLLFTAIVLSLHYWVPMRLGLVEYPLNEAFPALDTGISPAVIAAVIFVSGGVMGFIMCLFGEELAFRGYILPKLEESFGALKAVLLCSAIFALWHLPAYFSIYSGGAAERGWAAVGEMLLAHGISVIPVSILYLTTRELYGVSIYHALVDIFQYSIVGNPEFGETSKYALYSMKVSNETALDLMSWTWHGVGIIVMLGLCSIAKRWVVKYGVVEKESTETATEI
ncbi:MAG TPA: type II CAAX endopeptidase family protein [archaeon]|nr:type II CAAX endopeptidase family protein [archaeon]